MTQHCRVATHSGSLGANFEEEEEDQHGAYSCWLVEAALYNQQ